jgi:hypothetical protein
LGFVRSPAAVFAAVAAVASVVVVVVRAPVCGVRELKVEPPAGRPALTGDAGAVGEVGEPGGLEEGPAAAWLMVARGSTSTTIKRGREKGVSQEKTITVFELGFNEARRNQAFALVCACV